MVSKERQKGEWFWFFDLHVIKRHSPFTSIWVNFHALLEVKVGNFMVGPQ